MNNQTFDKPVSLKTSNEQRSDLNSLTRRVKSNIYILHYLVLKYKSPSTQWEILIILIQLFQFLAFTFNPHFETLQNPKPLYRALQCFFSYFQVVDFFKGDTEMYLIYLFILILIALLIISTQSFIIFNHNPHSQILKTVIEIYSLILYFSSTVMFIPIFSLFLSLFSCGEKYHKYAINWECWTNVHIVYIIIGMIFVWIYWINCGLFLTMYFETVYQPNNPMSKYSSASDVHLFLIKIIITAVFQSINDDFNKWILIAFVTTCSVSNYNSSVWNDNEYCVIIRWMKKISASIIWWSSFVWWVNQVLRDVLHSGIVVFLIGCPIIIVLLLWQTPSEFSGLLVSVSKMNKAFDYQEKINSLIYLVDNFSSREAQITLRGYACHMEKNCAWKNCPLEKYINTMNSENRDEPIVYLIKHIESIYQIAISKNPNDLRLRLNYAMFLTERLHNKHRAMQEITSCEKLINKDWENEFILYRYKRQYEETGDFKFDEDANESSSSVWYYSTFQKFKALITKASLLYIDFWSWLYENHMEHQQSLGRLNEFGTKINHEVNDIKLLFATLQKWKPNDQEILIIYIDFLKEILFDIETANELKDKLKELEETGIRQDDDFISYTNFDVHSINHNDDNYYIIIDTKATNFSVIINISLGLCASLGFTRNELLGKTIDIMLPDFMRCAHRNVLKDEWDNYWKNVKDTASSVSELRENKVKSIEAYAINKSKYWVPFDFQTQIVKTNDNETYWWLKVKRESYFLPNRGSVNLNKSWIDAPSCRNPKNILGSVQAQIYRDDLNTSSNTGLVITNNFFFIQNFSGSCIKLLGLDSSMINNKNDITWNIKEFHEEFLRLAIDKEDKWWDDKIGIKAMLVKKKYKHNNVITWSLWDYSLDNSSYSKKWNSVNENISVSELDTGNFDKKVKIKKNVFWKMLISELVWMGKCEGYIFKFEYSNTQAAMSSAVLANSEDNHKSYSNIVTRITPSGVVPEVEKSRSNMWQQVLEGTGNNVNYTNQTTLSFNRFHMYHPMKQASEIKLRVSNIQAESLVEEEPIVFDKNYVPSFDNSEAFKFDPVKLSYKWIKNYQSTLGTNTMANILKNKAIQKLEQGARETTSLSNSSDTSDNPSNTDESFKTSDLSISNHHNTFTRNNSIRTSSNNDEIKENYYKVNLSKIKLTVYDYKKLGFYEKSFEKKSKVDEVKGDCSEWKPEEIKKEKWISNKICDSTTENDIDCASKTPEDNAIKLIKTALNKEESQPTIIKLHLISLFVFLMLIGELVAFIVLRANSFNILGKKTDQFWIAIQILKNLIQGIDLVREWTLFSFDEYMIPGVPKEKEYESITSRWSELYINTTTIWEDVASTSDLWEKENYDALFISLIPVYWLDWKLDVNSYYLSVISVVSKTFTSLYQIGELTVQQALPLNPHVFFYLKNSFSTIHQTAEIAGTVYKEEIIKYANSQEILFIIVLCGSSAVILCSFILVEKAFKAVTKHKDSYWEIFFEIDNNIITASWSKCENFAKKIQNSDDDNGNYSSAENDSDINDEEQGWTALADKSNKTKEQNRPKEHHNENSRETIIKFLFLLVLVITVIYNTFLVLVYYSFVSSMKAQVNSYLLESTFHNKHLMLFNLLREYLFDNQTAVNGEYIKDIIDREFQDIIKTSIAINLELSLYKSKLSDKYNTFRAKIYNEDLCNYTALIHEYMSTEVSCDTIWSQSIRYGFSVLLSAYLQEWRELKSQGIETYRKQDQNAFNWTWHLTEQDSGNALLDNSTFKIWNNKQMKWLEVLNNYMFWPIFNDISVALQKSIKDHRDNTELWLLLLNVSFIICLCAWYFLWWRRYIISLNQVIYKTKNMWLIIPKEVLASLKSIHKLLNIPSSQGLQKENSITE